MIFPRRWSVISPGSVPCGTTGCGASADRFWAGESFAAVDAFFAPVAFRIQTGIGIALDKAAGTYAQRLLGLRSMRDWYADALKEKFRDPPHEEEMAQMGTVTEQFQGALAAPHPPAQLAATASSGAASGNIKRLGRPAS